jgi:membrane-associated phospholipid phosphatase
MFTIGQRLTACLVLHALILMGCAEGPTTPEDARIAGSVAPFSAQLLSPQWQARARSLVAANSPTPPAAGRTYAALSVAQYRAILAADEDQSADEGGGRSRFEKRRGAVSGASAQVLSFLFPSAAATLEQQVIADGTSSGGDVHPQFTLGVAIGRLAGDAMIQHLQSDGSAIPWPGTIPVGPGFWMPSGTPAGANLGGVKPYLLASTSQFRSAPPPAFGSQAFQTDLNEVLTVAQNRTPQDIALALFWAFLGPTPTPLGIWNELAATYVQDARLNERAATHVFALMHAAQFDAQLGCFEAKYHYFYIRPHQANPAIPTLFTVPNHPAYPSGHSCISSSAARVLEHFFPAKAAELSSLEQDAGFSRIIAGIHYRFDITAGKILGNAVAEWAIKNEQGLR